MSGTLHYMAFCIVITECLLVPSCCSTCQYLIHCLTDLPPSAWTLCSLIYHSREGWVAPSLWLSLSSEYSSLRHIPRSSTGLEDSSTFHFVRNSQTIFQSSHTILHCPWQSTSVPISPHPLQDLLFSIILIIATLVDVKWHPVVVLICIPPWLMTGASFYLLLGEVCISLGAMSFQVLCPFFKIELVVFFIIVLQEFFFYSNISPSSTMWLQICFPNV